jgi:hypothetical protein
VCADVDPQRAPINRHRLIVRHPSRADVIGVERSGALPRFDTDDRHTADVDHIDAAVEARYGLRATVLRSLLHGDVRDGVVERAHELEVHGGTDGALVWRAARSVDPRDDADRAVLDAWRAPFEVAHGRDWMAPGWYARACAWIEAALHRAGLGAVATVRQLRAWHSSCVLRVDYGDATAYFKAMPDDGAEFAVTVWLAEQFAHHTAPLIAADPARRWLLLGACAGRNLEAVGDVAAWAAAARHYGALQLACITRIEDLRRAGCATRSLQALPAAVAALAGDEGALRAGVDGLNDAELAALRSMVPRIAMRCAELTAIGVPDSLEHGDLWPGNVFVDGDAGAIIDWEDVAIAHPFFSIAPLIVGLGNAGMATAPNVARLEREYARAFEPLVAAADVRRAIDLAAPLCFLDMAARYRAQRGSVMRLHPWMRDLVPRTVRLALARL